MSALWRASEEVALKETTLTRLPDPAPVLSARYVKPLVNRALCDLNEAGGEAQSEPLPRSSGEALASWDRVHFGGRSSTLMLIFRASSSSASEGDEEAPASPDCAPEDPWVGPDFPNGIPALQEAEDTITATKTEAVKNRADFRERGVTQTLHIHSARSGVA